MDIPKQFVINLKGNEFVKYDGLLNAFHENGGESIKTEIISNDPFIMQATVSGEKGVYQGIGDASEDNVNRMIAKHKIRMAETRAIARALRWYNNVGMCSVEELGGDDNKSKSQEDNKDWLNDLEKDLKGGSKTLIENFKDGKSAVIALRKKFKVSKKMAKQVNDLYN